MAQTRTLLAVCVGLALAGASARRTTQDESVPMVSLARSAGSGATEGATPIRSAGSAILLRRGAAEAVFSHGDDDDQPAGACWLASVGGLPDSCLCSAGSVEDLLTPDFMRVLLASWRDAGRLTTGEWRERLQEVDAACRPGRAAP